MFLLFFPRSCILFASFFVFFFCTVTGVSEHFHIGEGTSSGEEDDTHGGHMSGRMFQRAASMARAAGMNIHLTEKQESNAAPDEG